MPDKGAIPVIAITLSFRDTLLVLKAEPFNPSVAACPSIQIAACVACPGLEFQNRQAPCLESASTSQPENLQASHREVSLVAPKVE
jgi:hypothetical protein